MPSVTRVRVRYKDTDTMSVDGVAHEWRSHAELGGTSQRDGHFRSAARRTAGPNVLAAG
jgi:hypothetical protein